MEFKEFMEGIHLVQTMKRESFDKSFVESMWKYFHGESAEVWMNACTRLTTKTDIYGKVEFSHFLECVNIVRDKVALRKDQEQQRKYRAEARQKVNSEPRRIRESLMEQLPDDSPLKIEMIKTERIRKDLLQRTIQHAKNQGEDTNRRSDESEDEWLTRIQDAARKRLTAQALAKEQAADLEAIKTFKDWDKIVQGWENQDAEWHKRERLRKSK